MELVVGSGPHLTDEIGGLLQRRLRMAGTIAAAGFGIFFIRNLFLEGDGRPENLAMILHGITLAVLAISTAVLWLRKPCSITVLRSLELTMFGAMALYFGFMQMQTFAHGSVLEWAKPGFEERLLRLATASNSLRWFVLIVLYGTFIPNTWQRCALVVGVMAATPIALTFLVCHRCPVMNVHTNTAMFDFVVFLGIASSIAVFGSHRINSLRRQVYEARKLNQYQLFERLGAGGMGEVFRGEHVLLRRTCAIKLIRADQANDPVTLSRFEREVQAMANLTHWNSVEVYDYGRAEDGTFYYVMEYLPGMSLQELTDRFGPLPPGRAVHFLRQVCAALREAHGIGVIHRDIKPSNIIACERGGVQDVAKLLDFGLVQCLGIAKCDSKLTIQGTILGSPPYMSPEQAMGKDKIDVRTDIYSLGALAYFLVTGQPPFVRETAMEMLVCHVHEPVTPPTDHRPELPYDLQQVILRCLSKSPEDRFQDIVSVERALAECACVDDWTEERAQQWWHEGRSPRREVQEVVDKYSMSSADGTPVTTSR